MKELLQKMHEEAKNSETLEEHVLNDLIDLEEEEVITYIQDVLYAGCQSGAVSGLIYYKDTYKFYEKYFEQIHEILDEIKENQGEEFSNYSSPRYNTLAWLGYEETLRKIADQLNLNV